MCTMLGARPPVYAYETPGPSRVAALSVSNVSEVPKMWTDHIGENKSYSVDA